MAKKNSRRRQAWDPATAKYASLKNPEWLTMKKLPPLFWDDAKNQERFMKWFAKQHEIKRLDDWYNVSKLDFIEYNGGGLLSQYGGSYIDTIMSLVSNSKWCIWMFRHTKGEFWTVKKNRIDYLKWLGKRLGYKKPEDWYQVSFKDFVENYGGPIARPIGKSVRKSRTTVEIVSELYPRFDWLPWKFNKVPWRYWENKSNRLKFMKWLGKELGFKKKTDWYQLCKRDFQSHGAQPLLQHQFQGVPYNAVVDSFPNFGLKSWLFNSIPNMFWEEKENRVDYLTWLGNKLKVKEPEGWYQVNYADFKANSGGHLLRQYYDGSIIKAIEELYPRRNWYPWLRNNISLGFWESKPNRKLYYKWLGKQLRFKKKTDWLKLSSQHLRDNSGGRLMKDLTLKQIRKEASLVK